MVFDWRSRSQMINQSTRILRALACCLILPALNACFGPDVSYVETYVVEEGAFESTVNVTGELGALRSKVINAPAIDWRFSQLKISKLVDDGKWWSRAS